MTPHDRAASPAPPEPIRPDPGMPEVQDGPWPIELKARGELRMEDYLPGGKRHPQRKRTLGDRLWRVFFPGRDRPSRAGRR